MEQPTKANSLYLTIKQVYFDQIVAGTKKEEYREVKDTTYTSIVHRSLPKMSSKCKYFKHC